MRPFLLRMAPATSLLVVCFVVPVAVFFAYSFGHATAFDVRFGRTLDNYVEVFDTSLYVTLLIRTLLVGVVVGVLCVVVAYPLAYAISLGPLRHRGDTVLFLVIASLFSAYIVRVYAWRSLLGRHGVINSALESIGLGQLDFLLYSRFAVVLTLVNVLVPLAVLPLYSALADVDRQVVEAARSLGASPLRAFTRVTLPLSSRGVKAAFALCCIVAAGDYVTPQLVGSPASQLVGNAIVQNFGVTFNWPLGSALAFTLLAASGLAIGALMLVWRLLGLEDRPV